MSETKNGRRLYVKNGRRKKRPLKDERMCNDPSYWPDSGCWLFCFYIDNIVHKFVARLTFKVSLIHTLPIVFDVCTIVRSPIFSTFLQSTLYRYSESVLHTTRIAYVIFRLNVALYYGQSFIMKSRKVYDGKKA